MSTHLQPGDLVYFLSAGGLKLRARVIESLEFRARGESLMVPVVRAIQRKKTQVAVDQPGGHLKEPKVRWVPRDQLRKLPTPAPKPDPKPEPAATAAP